MLGGPVYWFAMQNYPHAPWDYKVQGPYDDAGNFNYGASGAAVGIPTDTLINGANQYKNLINYFRHRPMKGNEPQKNEMIRRGINYFKNGCATKYILTQVFLASTKLLPDF